MFLISFSSPISRNKDLYRLIVQHNLVFDMHVLQLYSWPWTRVSLAIETAFNLLHLLRSDLFHMVVLVIDTTTWLFDVAWFVCKKYTLLTLTLLLGPRKAFTLHKNVMLKQNIFVILLTLRLDIIQICLSLKLVCNVDTSWFGLLPRLKLCFVLWFQSCFRLYLINIDFTVKSII